MKRRNLKGYMVTTVNGDPLCWTFDFSALESKFKAVAQYHTWSRYNPGYKLSAWDDLEREGYGIAKVEVIIRTGKHRASARKNPEKLLKPAKTE